MTQMLAASYVAAHFSDLAGLVALVMLAWVVLRSGGASALSVLKVSNEVLADKVDELEKARTVNAARIATLEAKTDVSLALRPLVEAMNLHDGHAKQRADAQLAVLEAIAASVGATSPLG